MPIEPLFVSDMDTLKSRLRLSGASSADALAIIDQAVEDVRVRLLSDERGLGVDLCVKLRAIAYAENSLDADTIRRTRANSLEVKMVRALLLRRMPTLFMDGSGVVQEVWNEEPITRARPDVIAREIEALEQEIADDLDALLDEEQDSDNDAFVIEPDETPPLAFDTIRPIHDPLPLLRTYDCGEEN